MPPNVDVNLIREALMRRMQGAGAQPQPTLPMMQQLSQPNTALPTGGPNVTNPQPLPMPNAGMGEIPQQGSPSPAGGASPTQDVAKTAQTAAGMPDEETKMLAKALVSKLVKYL